MLSLHRLLMVKNNHVFFGSLSLNFGWLNRIFQTHHQILILDFVNSIMFYLFSLSCCFKSNFQTVGLIFVQSPGSPRSGLGTTPLLTAVQACHLEAGTSGDQWFDGHKNGEYKLEYYIYIILYILYFITWYMFRLFFLIYLFIYIHMCVLYIIHIYIYMSYIYIYVLIYVVNRYTLVLPPSEPRAARARFRWCRCFWKWRLGKIWVDRWIPWLSDVVFASTKNGTKWSRQKMTI